MHGLAETENHVWWDISIRKRNPFPFSLVFLVNRCVTREQSNAEYDITHVVDSSTVDLEQSNAE
jgi:hypothetical protein